jgi:hypothetical protein
VKIYGTIPIRLFDKMKVIRARRIREDPGLYLLETKSFDSL